MKNIIELISRFKDFLVYLFFSFLSLYLLFTYGYHHQNSFLNTSSAVMGSIYEKTSVVTDYLALQNRNEELIIALSRSRMENLDKRLTRDSTFNRLDSIRGIEYIYRPAKVINKTTSYRTNYLTLDKGSIHGVQLNDGVVSVTNGLVGRITKVSEHFSLVTPIINSKMALRVSLKKNNATGLLQWDGADISKAQVNEIGKRVNVQEGDTIITTASSKFLPKNVVVGYVEKTEENGDIQNIDISLKTDYHTVLDVYVISNLLREEQVDLESNFIPQE